MNPGNPWGNFYGQLPPSTQQYDAPMHIIPPAGLQSGGLSPVRPVMIPGSVSYPGSSGSVFIDPPLSTQQQYKSVIVSQPPLSLQQTLPSSQGYSVSGVGDPKPWGSCNTVDASILGLSSEPPPAHSGHTQLSPGLFKVDQPMVISAAHQSTYKPVLTEPLHTPVHSVYQEPRVNQPAVYSSSPVATSAPVVSQQSSAYFNPQGSNPYAMSSAFNTGEQYNTSLSFQDMQDIGSEKVSMQMQPHGSVSPSQLSPHAPIHHSPHMSSHPSPHTVSPSHPQALIGTRNSPHTTTHSPHEASPSYSPHSSNSVSISSTIPTPPIAVQALADSTTKPRRKNRKKSKTAQENGDSVKHIDPHQQYTSLPNMSFAVELQNQLQFDKEMSAVTGELPNQMYDSQTIHQQQLSHMMQSGAPNQEMQMMDQGHTTYLYEDQQQFMGGEYIGSGDHLEPQQMFMTQQEEPPRMVTVVADLEEEFGHLSAPPEIPRPKPKVSPPPKPVSPPPKPKITPVKPKPPPEPVVPKFAAPVTPSAVPVPMLPALPKGPKPVDSTSFQSSFLSFLEGKKPETLSSVTSGSSRKKPILPKYAPDTRSAATAPKRAASDDEGSGEDTTADDNAGDDSAKDVKPSNEDTQEDSQDESRASSASESSEKVVQKTPSRGVSRGRGRGRGKYRGAPRSKQVIRVIESGGATEDSNDTDGARSAVEGMHTPSPPPPPRRASSGRRAAAVSQQKLRRQVRGESDSDEDYVATAESSDVSEAGYDSDKDPSWDPSENPIEKRKKEVDSDDEVIDRRSRGRGKRFKGTAVTPKSGSSRRGRPPVKTIMSEEDLYANLSPTVGETPTPFVVDFDAPHKYQKGDFVIDRKDYASEENFPIWRIDASRLLQKFEPVYQDTGPVLHKSLSTYSSWSGEIRHQFKGIMVKALSHVGGVETVQILDEFLPKKNSSEVGDDDPMLEKFTVYVQVLISQAMEPGFLRAITEEKDEYYNGPLEEIDGKLEACKEVISEKVQWKEDFQKWVETYPHLTVMARPNMKMLCQVCKRCGVTATKMIQLYGAPYSRETLHADEDIADVPEKRDFPACATASYHLQHYHSSHHFKYGLFKRCNAKVSIVQEEKEDAETREILDQCLQNRSWVNKLFAEFRELIGPYAEDS